MTADRIDLSEFDAAPMTPVCAVRAVRDLLSAEDRVKFDAACATKKEVKSGPNKRITSRQIIAWLEKRDVSMAGANETAKQWTLDAHRRHDCSCWPQS